MERKIKIIGLYVGLLFFISILLILITSLSNDKFDPMYNATENTHSENTGLETTVMDSVSNITETNKILNEKITEYQNKVIYLESVISEKDAIIKEYEKRTNIDSLNLSDSLKFYVLGNIEDSKELLEKVIKENLSEEEIKVYDYLVNELN